VVGAIVVVESEGSRGDVKQSASIRSMFDNTRSLACVEVLGRSILERTIDHLQASGIDSIAVVGSGAGVRHLFDDRRKLASPGSLNVWHHAIQRVIAQKEQGCDAILIVALGPYSECNAADLIRFHREQGGALTRAVEEQGALDLWVIDPAAIPYDHDLKDYLRSGQASEYPVRCYVNRLENPRDLRNLIADGLSSRCWLRPQGFEVKPGVWMAEGGVVDRGARIVAPAFIGRGAKVGNQCLITRCSNLESDSRVDYGTVIEDSSVLSNTYVGIGLDLSHSIVDGNRLANLRHDVILEISDSVVLRRLEEGKSRAEASRRFLANFKFDEVAISSGEDLRR
jgi:NDP-sugar pyrophosphorylase family protein